MLKFKKWLIFSFIIAILVFLAGGIVNYASNKMGVVGEKLSILFNTPGRLTNTYDNEDSRYIIHYPVDWSLDKSVRGTVVFSGRENTRSAFSTVNIQVILTKKMKGEYSTVAAFVEDIKAQVRKESPQAVFFDEAPIEVKEKDGGIAKGWSVTFSYDYEGQPVKQWQVVVLRADEQVFYAWAYTSSETQFEVDLPIAKAMFSSWVIY